MGDVRGEGLMLGVEIVKDRKTKEHSADDANKIFNMLKDYGILCGRNGFYS